MMKMNRPLSLRGASAIALACLVLAGCAVGPDYQRPDAPVPKAFKEASEAMPAWTGDWKTAEPQDATARADWWRVFGDPALDDLMAQVQISNQNIKAAEAQYRQATASLQAARAGFFPVIGASAGLSRGASSTGGRITNGQNATLSASWEIDVWGRIRRQVESAQAGAQASQADLAATLLSTQATLAQSYFLLRIADSQRALLDRTVADYEKSLLLVRNQYQAGTAQRSDVLQSETQLKSAQAQQIDIQITRAQLEHAIAVLVGKPPADLTMAVVEVDDAIPNVPVAVPSTLLERRPDIAAAERRMASANADIGVAQAAYYPTLSLSATGGLTAGTLARWLSLPDRVWSVGAGLAGTVFDGGLRGAAKAQAVAAYDQTVANYRQTVLGAFQEVEDNLAAARLLGQEATVQNDALRSAREALALVNNRYKAGTAGLLDVLTAQTAAYTAERTALSITGRQYTAAVTLIAALGGGWHDPSAEAAQPPVSALSSTQSAQSTRSTGSAQSTD
ncbi:putative efflux pump outer membrane protein TtgC precursor [compost metagenome]|uniref:Efflux transporter outer membrane subunit n=1 Tax=Cupriavidus campinensis TaxID=151783 RepID=A0AAE9I6B7_9BURK|nr:MULTISPECIES: efflux transporter outer membrane subunit [Cupriavidus]URF04791.1 efflux transporter outer membrane subunit [Cupriavidus campinensis]CAG2148854.1 putative efflux pump outer membrane protein TtgC [Cupriavidus campinensis]